MSHFGGHGVSAGVSVFAGTYWTIRFCLQYIKVHTGGGKFRSILNYPFTPRPSIPLDALFKLVIAIIGLCTFLPLLIWDSSHGKFWGYLQYPTHLLPYCMLLMSAAVDLISHCGLHLPKGLQHLMFALAWAAYGLLLQSHEKGEFLVLLHNFLTLTSLAICATVMLEAALPSQPLPPFVRGLLLTLQGGWFFQVDWLLGDTDKKWNDPDPRNGNFLAALFLIHVIVNMFLGVAVYLILLGCFKYRRNRRKITNTDIIMRSETEDCYRKLLAE